MRTCIIGGGLAGALLTWRLAQCPGAGQIDLVLGEDRTHDATGLSGGVVRGFEPHPEQRRLAVASLCELLESRVLRTWSQYRETGSIYLRQHDQGLRLEVHQISEALPDSATLLSIRELSDQGWAELPDGTVGVFERRAGYLSPSSLRDALLADLATRASATILPATAGVVAPRRNGDISCTVNGRPRDYDIAVVAAGAWTPRLMRASGLSVGGLRTKSIQYTLYEVHGRPPPPFVDETTGLYGRPVAGGGLLLGLPSKEWGVVAGPRPATPELHATARGLAATRLPRMTITSAVATVNGTDCYADPPVMSLRPVDGADGRILTFTGGSGGAVKTLLAASQAAAQQIIGFRGSPRSQPNVSLLESESA